MHVSYVYVHFTIIRASLVWRQKLQHLTDFNNWNDVIPLHFKHWHRDTSHILNTKKILPSKNISNLQILTPSR